MMLDAIEGSNSLADSRLAHIWPNTRQFQGLLGERPRRRNEGVNVWLLRFVENVGKLSIRLGAKNRSKNEVAQQRFGVRC
jgi:hypothetical protein